jgi:hypothetical protein
MIDHVRLSAQNEMQDAKHAKRLNSPLNVPTSSDIISVNVSKTSIYHLFDVLVGTVHQGITA